MDISLNPNIERFLRLKVAEGLYDSLNEAINATLNIVINNEYTPQEELAILNKEIQEGIDEADKGCLSDAFEFLDDLRKKYE